MKQLNIFPHLLGSIFFMMAIFSCSSENRFQNIFAIPTNTSAKELEENGYTISTDFGMTYCNLDNEDYYISIAFENDLDKISSLGFTITADAFSEMSKLSVGDYDSVRIENYDYSVRNNKETNDLYVLRLGM